MARPLRQMTKEEVIARLWEKTEVSDQGCWIYTGKAKSMGYPVVKWWGSEVGNRRVHSVSWWAHYGRGALRDGRVIDHRCHNDDPDCPGGECIHRCCWNPSHLRSVTRGESVLSGKTLTAGYKAQTHCKHGHEMTFDNTWFNAQGHRWCRKCGTIRKLERKLRQVNIT